MWGTVHVGPGLLLSPSLGPMCAQMLLFFVRSKCARAVLRAGLGWVCAVRRSRMRSTGKDHRARRPLASFLSRFERSRASLDLLQMPTASARLLLPSCGLVAWVSQGRAMLQVRRAAPIW